jgi:hypothetical protein
MLVCRLLPICGRPTLTIVLSRPTMNSALQQIASTTARRPEPTAAAGGTGTGTSTGTGTKAAAGAGTDANVPGCDDIATFRS